jgi:hypothetical protein
LIEEGEARKASLHDTKASGSFENSCKLVLGPVGLEELHRVNLGGFRYAAKEAVLIFNRLRKARLSASFPCGVKGHIGLEFALGRIRRFSCGAGTSPPPEGPLYAMRCSPVFPHAIKANVLAMRSVGAQFIPAIDCAA